MKRLLPIFVLFFSFFANGQIEKAIPSKPAPSEGLVLDYARTLTNEQKDALNQKLIHYNDSTSSQIAIVTIQSLKGYDVSDYAMAIGRQWGVGGKQFNNGVVILVSLDEHKIAIQVGYGLEGAIPDVTAKSIIDNDLTPNFRQQNYYRGFDQATDDLINAAAGRYKAPPNSGGKGKAFPFGVVIFIIIIMIIAISRGGGGKGGMMSRRGYGGFWTGWLLGNMLGGGWGGRSGGGGGWSGGGGGGFGGFGGGGFGGGGASGGW